MLLGATRPNGMLLGATRPNGTSVLSAASATADAISCHKGSGPDCNNQSSGSLEWQKAKDIRAFNAIDNAQAAACALSIALKARMYEGKQHTRMVENGNEDGAGGTDTTAWDVCLCVTPHRRERIIWARMLDDVEVQSLKGTWVLKLAYHVCAQIYIFIGLDLMHLIR